MSVQLFQGDCLEIMPALAPVDLVLSDLPYGVTARNSWDAVIPFGPLWAAYERLARGAVVLTATQPFARP
jgi:site-specific DNA-methyltransferase (adenine-specific)